MTTLGLICIWRLKCKFPITHNPLLLMLCNIMGAGLMVILHPSPFSLPGWAGGRNLLCKSQAFRAPYTCTECWVMINCPVTGKKLQWQGQEDGWVSKNICFAIMRTGVWISSTHVKSWAWLHVSANPALRGRDVLRSRCPDNLADTLLGQWEPSDPQRRKFYIPALASPCSQAQVTNPHTHTHTTNTYHKHTPYLQNNKIKYKSINRLASRIVKVLFLLSLCPLSWCPQAEEKALDVCKWSTS